jgi:predicted nucleic acid-binding Zn ribbon protein
MATTDPRGGSEEAAERRRAALRDLVRRCQGAPRDPEERMHRAGDLLARVLEAVGAAEGIDEQELKDAWRRLAGDAVAAHCEPAAFRKGIVELRVLQPAMRFHLEQMKPVLLRRLRQELGGERVRGIRFVIG